MDIPVIKRAEMLGELLKVKTNKYGNLFQANGSTLHYGINNKKEVIDLKPGSYWPYDDFPVFRL